MAKAMCLTLSRLTVLSSHLCQTCMAQPQLRSNMSFEWTRLAAAFFSCAYSARSALRNEWAIIQKWHCAGKYLPIGIPETATFVCGGARIATRIEQYIDIALYQSRGSCRAAVALLGGDSVKAGPGLANSSLRAPLPSEAPALW